MSATTRSAMGQEEVGGDVAQSRFTAVNGNASPGARSQEGLSLDAITNGNEPGASPGRRRRDSQTSLGKRKRSISGASNNAKRVASNSDDSGASNRAASSTADPTTSPSHNPWPQQQDGEPQTDAQIADMLRQGADNPDNIGQQDYPGGPGSSSSGHGEGQQGQTPSGVAAPLLQKQRKRNFSNRTKTGCLTCRERKKKCDEGKPTCMNCERGGFRCKGYQQTNTVYRAPPVPQHIPLQAKNGAAFEFPHFQYGNRPPPMNYIPQGHQAIPPDDPQDPARSLPTPQEPHIRPGFARSWAPDHGAHQAPYMQDPMAMGRHDMPQPYQMSDPHGRPQPPKTLPPPPPPMHPPSHSAHRNSASSTPSFNPISTAQMALQHGSNNRQPSLSMYRTEKEKMLHGFAYNPTDAQLKEERKQCAIACFKFNQMAADPQNLTDAERSARFRQILEPKHEKSPNGQSPELKDVPIGHLGQRVTVEAPFNCEYGYNIQIGDDTDIGPNCRIYDGCTVKIGARCIVGPDVSFYGTDGDHRNVPRPHGKKRDFISKPIIVEDDVFIGGHAVLLGGCHIGKGATIAAGTVIKGRDRVSSPYLGYNQSILKQKGYWHQHQRDNFMSGKIDDDIGPLQLR